MTAHPAAFSSSFRRCQSPHGLLWLSSSRLRCALAGASRELPTTPAQSDMRRGTPLIFRADRPPARHAASKGNSANGPEKPALECVGPVMVVRDRRHRRGEGKAVWPLDRSPASFRIVPSAKNGVDDVSHDLERPVAEPFQQDHCASCGVVHPLFRIACPASSTATARAYA
jgi:hypothetical protein